MKTKTKRKPRFQAIRFAKVMNLVNRNKKEHNQRIWVCGTKACFFGHAGRYAFSNNNKALSLPEMLNKMGLSKEQIESVVKYKKELGSLATEKLIRAVRKWLGLNHMQTLWLFSPGRTRADFKRFLEAKGKLEKLGERQFLY